MLTLVTSSSKKEGTESGLKAVFSYVTDGYKVNFTSFIAAPVGYSSLPMALITPANRF